MFCRVLRNPHLLLSSLFAAACGPPTWHEPMSAGSSSTTGSPDTPTEPTSSGGLPSTTSTTDPAVSTTTTSSTTDMSTTESTSPDAMCGDGEIDAGEECDEGTDEQTGNRDDGPCTLDCKVAVCGDGKIWTDVEACDNAGANGFDYGGCSPSCEKNAYCGDSTVDTPLEQCDAGSENGSGMSDNSTVPCEIGCTWDGRVAFASSELYDADLGGLDGADQKCRTRAQAAGLRRWETYRAWLSNGTAGPLDRFVLLPAKPYVLPTGERVADSLSDLVINGPGDGIRVDEFGKPLPPSSKAWTNTGPAGAPYSPVNHCNEWDSAAFDQSARVGRSHVPHEPQAQWQTWVEDRQWTSWDVWKCFDSAHLYCFEQ